MRRDDVASMSVQRHFDIMCPLGSVCVGGGGGGGGAKNWLLKTGNPLREMTTKAGLIVVHNKSKQLLKT